MTLRSLLGAVSIGLVAIGCGGSMHGDTTSSAPTPIVGLTTRAEIERELPAWREAIASADPEDETARELASVPAGAEIDVFLGTWCGDSKREVARLFRALELVPEPWPFTIRFIGVDRAKIAPGLTEGVGLRYVPTIVVRRDGAEVGRIVESAPRAIERELVELLAGRTSGVITRRTDL